MVINMKKRAVNITFGITAAITFLCQVFCCIYLLQNSFGFFKTIALAIVSTLFMSPAYVCEYFAAKHLKLMYSEPFPSDKLYRLVLVLINCAVIIAYAVAFVGFSSGFKYLPEYTWAFILAVIYAGWWASLLLIAAELLTKRKKAPKNKNIWEI